MGGVFTAQARENVTDNGGFAFVHCNITGSGDTYLRRAWKERPRVVFAYNPLVSNGLGGPLQPDLQLTLKGLACVQVLSSMVVQESLTIDQCYSTQNSNQNVSFLDY
ncbi:hypothetical protein QYF36_018366 [Acer negundo]|nr:hypothetical protein QYF36_018366 [Acer negundo]